MLERAAHLRRDEIERFLFRVAWHASHWFRSGPPSLEEVFAMLRKDPPVAPAASPDSVAAFCRSLAARGFGTLEEGEVSRG